MNWIMKSQRKQYNPESSKYIRTEKLTKSGNPYMEYYQKETHGDITDLIVLQWTTPIEIYAKLTQENKSRINEIKNYLNSRASALSYHDGTQDPSCTFHTKHYHLIARLQTKEKHITSNYAFKQLKGKLNNWNIHTEKIKNIGN